MTTITISRQMGSLGGEIAHIVADLLNYRIVWRELINEAARRAGAPEAALAAIDELGLLGICPSPDACLAYRKAVEQVMQELAVQGNVVIVGRAGQVVLAGDPGTFRVRIFAPAILRAERIAKRLNITQECALAQVETSDRFRSNYLKRFYHVRWDNPELYHLTINTGRMQAIDVAKLICQAVLNHSIGDPTSPE
jgi:cytidylate kinase